MVVMLLLLATIGIGNAAENAYKSLSITLPQNLMEHITAIHNNKLYVFGGRNSTETSGGTKQFYNRKFYRIDLNDKFTLTGTDNDDITHTLQQTDWETLDITAPSYGDSSTSKGLNEFVCQGQCSVVIGDYLYIVAPYTSNTTLTSSATSNTIYRLDLSQATPQFADLSTTGFTSSIPYDTAATGHCVTKTNELMYITNGFIQYQHDPAYSPETISYDPSNTATKLSSMTKVNYVNYDPGRRNAGCAPNIGQTKIYLFGGRGDVSSNAYGMPGIDYYTIKTDEWTENAEEYDWDRNNGDLTKSRNRMKCFKSLYKNTIECPGGFGPYNSAAIAIPNSLIWDITTSKEESVALNTAVFSAGTQNYQFWISDDGTYAASLALIIGGATGSGLVATAEIQYAVRYSQVTGAPSAAPVQSPTMDTNTPTPAPSQSPLCPTCSRAPTNNPTPSPVDDPGNNGDGVQQINVFLSMLIVMVSVIIYV